MTIWKIFSHQLFYCDNRMSRHSNWRCKEYVMRNNKFALTYCKRTMTLFQECKQYYVVCYIICRWKDSTFLLASVEAQNTKFYDPFFFYPQNVFPCNIILHVQNYALTYPLATKRRMLRNYNRVPMPKKRSWN